MTDVPKPADAGDHPTILVSDRQDRPLDVDGLSDLAAACLRGEGIRSAELSVSFVSSREMSDLHERFMGETGPTDVLSFPQDDDGQGGVRVLGDVVIAPEVAASNNPEDVDAELRLLLVHGILHLLGYDHEDEDERAEMWARQESYTGVRVP